MSSQRTNEIVASRTQRLRRRAVAGLQFLGKAGRALGKLAYCFLVTNDWHAWEYRTPCARKCKKCGRHENLHYVLGGRDQWEQVYPLPHTPDACYQEE